MPKWRGGTSSSSSSSARRSSTLSHAARPQQQQQQQRRRHTNSSSPTTTTSSSSSSSSSSSASLSSRIAKALVPPGQRRQYLGAALFLIATGVILGNSLGRRTDATTAGDLHQQLSEGHHHENGKSPLPVDSGSPSSRPDGGSSGDPWYPPDERPIPLDKFPRLNGVGFKADGGLLDVQGYRVSPPLVGEGGAPQLSLDASSSGGGGGGGSSSVGRERGDGDGNLAEGAVVPRGEEGEPTTTLLFMHLWKCAGSSLRHLLRDWAEAKRQDIGIVVRCTDPVNEEGKICMQRHALIDEQAQVPFIRRQQVIAGHFTWGFQERVHQPFVMFTTLRNPLELFVSGQQYLNRKASRHFAHAVSLVQDTMALATKNHYLKGGVMMAEGKGNAKSVGFIYRLVDPVLESSSEGGKIGSKRLETAAQEAKDHLDTFWLVGVIEQYKGFMAVLQAMMDPLQSERQLWKSYAVGRYNKSPQGAGKVLAAIDPRLVREFNNTLRYQWDVYGHAVELYKHRCRQMLHTRDHLDLCDVPVAPSEYTLTDLEQESLYQELHPEQAGLNATELLRAQQLWSEHAMEDNGDVEEAFEFLQQHGFDLTEPEQKESLRLRLGIGVRSLSEEGVRSGDVDGGVGDNRALTAYGEEEAGGGPVAAWDGVRS